MLASSFEIPRIAYEQNRQVFMGITSSGGWKGTKVVKCH